MNFLAQVAKDFNSNPYGFSQFATVIDEDVQPLTSPNIILEGGIQQIGLKRLRPEDIEKFLLVHPAVPRGIEIRANRMTSRGYTIRPANKSQQAKRAAKEMADLIENSGGVMLLNSYIQNTDGFGNGYLTLIPNKAGDKIVQLRLEHPIYFRIAKHKKATTEQMNQMNLYSPEMNDDFYHGYGPNKIDPITKQPAAYTQVAYTDPSKKYIKPIGEELKPDQVAHLVFDTWGDEVDGYSKLQYVHQLVNYLLNINEAAAEATYRAGFTQKKLTTEIMHDRELKEIAKNLKEINAKDAIILPKGVDLENLFPGTTQYPQIHDIFLSEIAIRLGIPKPILTLDGTSTNKATMEELTKDMMNDFRADELKVKKTIEDQIFKVACRKLFGETFAAFPTFDFNPFVESKDAKAARNFRVAQTLTSLTQSVATLMQAGYPDRAEQLLKFIDDVLPEPEAHAGVLEEQSNEPEKHNPGLQAATRSPKDQVAGQTVGRPEGSNSANVRSKNPPQL